MFGYLNLIFVHTLPYNKHLVGVVAYGDDFSFYFENTSKLVLVITFSVPKTLMDLFVTNLVLFTVNA